jgi:hypothetical protein
VKSGHKMEGRGKDLFGYIDSSGMDVCLLEVTKYLLNCIILKNDEIL